MTVLDPVDRQLVDRLQDGVPIARRPFEAVAAEIGIDEDEAAARVDRMLDSGVLTRFGPMFNVERVGGAFCLCAMAVPPDDFDRITEIVNAHAEVAHNYERDHELNMWFVLACDRPDGISTTAVTIEKQTGIEVLLFPKEAEYFIGFKVPA